MSFNIEWTNADALTPKQFTVYESVPVTYSTTTAPFGDLQREVRAGSSRFELLPCPFCGADAEIRAHPLALHDEESRGWEVACWKCGARVGSTVLPTGKTKEQAIAAWNRRADHD